MSRRDSYRCRVVIASITIAMALALAGPVAGDWECENYYDSREHWFWGYGWRCAYTGPGCTQCYDTETGESCTTPGDGYCSLDERY